MIDIPLKLLFNVIILILIVSIFLLFWGGPSCDNLADQTALYLKLKIDEVASDSVPFYTGGGVPDNPMYFRTTPIMLCQKYDKSVFLLTVFGGEPEYKLYYEVFPDTLAESGGFLWSESYPWSGNAANNLIFWGMMRGVSVIGGKLFKLSPLGMASEGVKAVKNLAVDTIGERAKPSNFFNYFKDKLLSKFRAARSFFKDVIEKFTEKDADDALMSGIWADFYETTFIEEANQRIPALLTVSDINTRLEKVVLKEKAPMVAKEGNVLKRVVVSCEGCTAFDLSKVDWKNVQYINFGENVPDGYVEAMFSPRQAMKEYIENLKKTDPARANNLLEIFAFDDVGANKVKFSDILSHPIAFIKSIKEQSEGRWSSFLKGIKEFWYDEAVVLEPEQVAAFGGLSIQEIFDDDEYKEILKVFLDDVDELSYWQKLKNSIKARLGLRDTDKITIERLKQFSKENYDMAEKAGFFMPQRDNRFPFWQTIINKVEDYYEQGLPFSEVQNKIYEDITKLPEYEKDFFKNYFSRSKVDEIVYEIHSIRSLSLTRPTYLKDSYKQYWKAFLNEYKDFKAGTIADPELKKEIGKDIAIFISVFDQDMSKSPIPMESLEKKFGIKEARKMLYIDSRQLLTPPSIIDNVFSGTRVTEECKGNSICLFKRGEMREEPVYLEKEALRFSGNIRVWRPIEPWQQYAGIQAAMHQIPSHPSFYVVSPCNANAKIWKTVYGGKDTIFIYPEKVDTGGKGSNYCYADNDLINRYVIVWLGSDIATFLESSLVPGSGLVKQIWSALDPVSLLQVLFEGLLSWPSYPFQPLNATLIKETRQTPEQFKVPKE